MATEIIHWCDVHLTRDERVPTVAAHNITVDGEPLVIELCEACEAGTWKEFRTYLAEHGVRPRDAGKPVVGTVRAPMAQEAIRCTWCSVVVHSAYALKLHSDDAHGFDYPSEGYGTACPLCEWQGSHSSTPQALAIHGGRGHDTPTLSELFARALAEGDPRGIVAERRAWVEARQRERDAG